MEIEIRHTPSQLQNRPLKMAPISQNNQLIVRRAVTRQIQTVICHLSLRGHSVTAINAMCNMPRE